MSAVDEFVASNARFIASRPAGIGAGQGTDPKVAVLTCMDARLDPARALGLRPGDAHVIRNAGGVATEDAIRSLVISQYVLGTSEVMVIHHTDCGMEKFRDDDLKDRITEQTGLRPPFALEAFPDAEADLAQTAARIKASPFLLHKEVRGFIYDVTSGGLREVVLA